jgi:hypothetical protein
LKDRQHQCPRRWRCGIGVIAAVVDEGPSRQCDIVSTRRVWDQVPCSRVDEQEENNRKHRLHICEYRCGDSGARQLEETTEECCFVFTQKEDPQCDNTGSEQGTNLNPWLGDNKDQSNWHRTGRIFTEEHGGCQVAVQGYIGTVRPVWMSDLRCTQRSARG